MATGNMHKQFGEVRLCSFRVMRADRQTDTLITILRNPTRDEVINGSVTLHTKLLYCYIDRNFNNTMEYYASQSVSDDFWFFSIYI